MTAIQMEKVPVSGPLAMGPYTGGPTCTFGLEVTRTRGLLARSLSLSSCCFTLRRRLNNTIKTASIRTASTGTAVRAP